MRFFVVDLRLRRDVGVGEAAVLVDVADGEEVLAHLGPREERGGPGLEEAPQLRLLAQQLAGEADLADRVLLALLDGDGDEEVAPVRRRGRWRACPP